MTLENNCEIGQIPGVKEIGFTVPDRLEITGKDSPEESQNVLSDEKEDDIGSSTNTSNEDLEKKDIIDVSASSNEDKNNKEIINFSESCPSNEDFKVDEDSNEVTASCNEDISVVPGSNKDAKKKGENICPVLKKNTRTTGVLAEKKGKTVTKTEILKLDAIKKRKDVRPTVVPG